MATKVDMRIRMLHLLTSNEAAGINFTFEGITFYGTYFGLVTMQLINRMNYVKAGIDLIEAGNQGVMEAAYNDGLDAFKVRDFAYGTTEYELNTLVHESVHAWLDTIKGGVPGASAAPGRGAEEALGYLVGAVFTLKRRASAGQSPPKAPTPAEWPDMMGSDLEAFKIAALIYNSPGRVVTAAEAKPLLDKVDAEYTAGVPGWDAKALYNNNGVIRP
jgi:hypothetical protein